jgi:hypothetical protein
MPISGEGGNMREFFFRYSDGLFSGTSARPNVLWQCLCIFPSTMSNLAARCDGALEQRVTQCYFNALHYYIPTELIYLDENRL